MSKKVEFVATVRNAKDVKTVNKVISRHLAKLKPTSAKLTYIVKEDQDGQN